MLSSIKHTIAHGLRERSKSNDNNLFVSRQHCTLHLLSHSIFKYSKKTPDTTILNNNNQTQLSRNIIGGGFPPGGSADGDAAWRGGAAGWSVAWLAVGITRGGRWCRCELSGGNGRVARVLLSRIRRGCDWRK